MQLVVLLPLIVIGKGNCKSCCCLLDGTTITSVEIMNGGSNYSAGTYFLDTRVIGAGTTNDFTVTASGISSPVGNVVQFTGIGTGTDTYHRITGVTGRNSISIARTTGDPVITADNYAFITAPSVANIFK